MRTRRCIAERLPMKIADGGWKHEPELIWHILPTGWDEPEADFAPILCSDDEGICLPGSSQTREPTCPDCIKAIGGAA